MAIVSSVRAAFNKLIQPLGVELVRSKDIVDFYLHDYKSYEEYRDIQIQYNKKKIGNVWADEATLDAVANELSLLTGRKSLKGICHGARNGFEQNYLRKKFDFDVFGTDISDTATQFENTVQWDFHDVNNDWVGRFDFVYSNSLDQGWNPRAALSAWLNQLNDGGFLVIEHTEAHGPSGASEMDPFGVRPTAMPYVLADWFGHRISMSVKKSKKANMDMDVWLFFVSRLVPSIE